MLNMLELQVLVKTQTRSSNMLGMVGGHLILLHSATLCAAKG
jgi:hypothetical protein